MQNWFEEERSKKVDMPGLKFNNLLFKKTHINLKSG